MDNQKSLSGRNNLSLPILFLSPMFNIIECGFGITSKRLTLENTQDSYIVKNSQGFFFRTFNIQDN